MQFYFTKKNKKKKQKDAIDDIKQRFNQLLPEICLTQFWPMFHYVETYLKCHPSTGVFQTFC